jgi:glycerol-3-phosphate dehydrogenase (NAD(P)+)
MTGSKIGIIGAGAWGTALAVVANRAGSDVTLWSRNDNVLQSVRQKRINEPYLPEVFLDPDIGITEDIASVCKSDFVMLSVPSQHIRPTCIAIADSIDDETPIVVATKGIERGSLALMSEVVHSIVPHNPILILTGPNFAGEAARGLPTATTVACADEKIGSALLYAIGGKYFRPYFTDDVVGAQVGGAVKNVIAIACGIALGRGFGENARAALITRGLAEIGRLCIAKGGRQQTLMGLSGFGDLVLTCGSSQSRNMSLGIDIGQGKSVKELLSGQFKGLAEGVGTAESVTELARKLGISMPICKAVRDILHKNFDIDITIQSLMERPFVSESLQTSV